MTKQPDADHNRTAREEIPPRAGNMTPEQQAGYEALMALARKTAARKYPGATSDHKDMYDDDGLPI
jgi:hypothetical protein